MGEKKSQISYSTISVSSRKPVKMFREKSLQALS